MLLDVLLPPRCIGCGEPVGRQGELCAGCWSGLRFFQPPWCRCCGRPLPHAAAGEPLCGACARAEPPFGRARAALAYDDASRSLILAFKHRDRLAGARTFARWMVAAGADVLPDCDVVAPVPLHRWRLLRRGYNQAAILGGLIARSAGLRWCPDLLERRHATASQQGLGAMARARNVTASAFRVARRHGETVRGSRILLVDDVMTTGSTLAACTSVLRRAGADHVYALALARVVLDESRTI
ncbi:MAG: ComF family protein [Geminicoccaceae bacterium]